MVEALLLGSGNDTVFGSAGTDRINGGNGNDQIDGGDGADDLLGGGGNDFLSGKGGNDTLGGGSGNDALYGDAGTDSLDGGADFDTLIYRPFSAALTVNFTAAGTGTISDGVETDAFTGMEAYILGTGNDTFNGSSGDDVVNGWTGNDVLNGNGGSDTFAFQSTGQSTRVAPDSITDFAAGDTIDLSAIDANGSAAGNGAFSYVGTSDFSKVAGELRYDAATQSIQGDVNGDGHADIIIVLSNGYVPVSGDFVL